MWDPGFADDDLDGLPMRVRQANLAPQLRTSRPAEQRDVTIGELVDLIHRQQQATAPGGVA